MELIIDESNKSHESTHLLQQKNNKRKLGEVIQILSGSRKRKCVRKHQPSVEEQNIPVQMSQ
jgi:hypothetical protein